ncbi:hypothetical protein [Salegentibacter sp. Hel_I_6]|uniref:hypothetical protein n=1 Tax=Salegentibacter sp. Hel_I_6 TaxID=1250278 RepID=UPI000563F417|nr:hypothetical protein [Salegentibacter sp. Hel_I_6]
MKILLFLALCATISSCSTAPNSPADLDTKEITGKWQLIETLADPGDGSGTWQTVENGRTLEFSPNGLVKTSGSFCNEEEINETSYDNAEKMISTDCGEKIIELRYELKEGDLFIYPHNPRCVEACGSKYRKIED